VSARCRPPGELLIIWICSTSPLLLWHGRAAVLTGGTLVPQSALQAILQGLILPGPRQNQKARP
jgi:hypothetical protein